MKTLIRTKRRDATVERGAPFHPTISFVTPNGFTIGHPRARPRCFEIESFILVSAKVRDKGYSPSLNTKIYRDEGYSPSLDLVIDRDEVYSPSPESVSISCNQNTLFLTVLPQTPRA
jgi:hypothetical protein